MTRRLLLLLSLLLPFALSAGAAVHVWRGTASDRFSNPANWDGGSPAGDPAADLSFPFGSRTIAVNDIPGLRVRSIALSGSVTISGNALTFLSPATIDDSSRAAAAIACDIVLTGPLAIHRASAGNPSRLAMTGSISGAGNVTTFGDGAVTFGGTAPNTYAGTTFVRGYELRLEKPPGVQAVPGNVIVGSGAIAGRRPHLLIPGNEQLADSATVTVRDAGELQVGGVETIGPLVLGSSGSLQMAIAYSGSYPLTGRLVVSGDMELESASQPSYVTGYLALAGSRTITVAANAQAIDFDEGLLGVSPTDGLTVRGPVHEFSRVRGTGRYTGPTIVEGSFVTMSLTGPVIVRGGTFSGSVASIDVQGGQLRDAQSQSSLRLSPAATVQLRVGDTPTLVANGPVDLGGASATLNTGILPLVRGRTYTLVENRSASPTTGTFAGWPEGAVIGDRFRISYGGGSGNDVVLTHVGRHDSVTSLSIDPQPASDGQPARLTAEVTPVWGSTPGPLTGTVTFLEGTTELATVGVDASRKATTTVTLPWGTHTLTARYDGSADFAPSQGQRTMEVLAPKPIVTEVAPGTAVGGTEAELTIRGTNFLPGALLFAGSFGYSTTFVSASELRGTIRPFDGTTSYDLQLRIQQPKPCCVESDPFVLRVTARHREPSPLAFEKRQVSAPVAAGATSAWLARTPTRTYALGATDEDRDGWARLQLTQDLPFSGIWTAVDVSTGRLMAGEPGGFVPQQQRFPSKMFLRDPAGNVSFGTMTVGHGVSWHFLWVRPGVGAWHIRSSNGLFGDLDRTFDRRLVFTTALAQRLIGPADTPAGFEKGDVFVAIETEGRAWFGATLGSQLDEASAPGILELAYSGPRENEGVARVYVVRTEGTAGTISIRYATRDDTAIAGVDYRLVSGTLEFGPGEVVKSVDIPIIDNASWDDDRQFDVVFSDPAGTELRGRSSAVVIIDENEPPPEVSFGDATIAEGDSGTRLVALPATLSLPASRPVAVTWSGGDGSDSTQTLVFAPGETRKTISVAVAANTRPEPDRVVHVFIRKVENGDWKRMGEITVIDDDFAEVTISDATVNEADGSVSLVVTLSRGGKPSTLRYAAHAGSADAGVDFTAASGTLRMNSFSTTATITIPILNDSIGESPEWFSVVLFDASGARIARGTAVVSITDDEPPTAPATVSARGASIDEGDSGSRTVRALVELSKPATAPVTVPYDTTGGTATAGVDFVPRSGTVVFAAGERQKTVEITIHGDTELEGHEHFFVNLGTVAGVTLENAHGRVTIVDDDGRSRRHTSRH